jgi:hypothetical protein
VHIILEN